MSVENDLPKGWVKENLAKCLEKVIDYRGKTPKKANDGILTLSAKSVKMGYIDYSEAYFISKSTYDSFMVRGFPKKGDILMTTEAPLGCIAKLDRDNVGVAQRLLTLRGKKGVLNNDYLKYYLTSRIGQHELLSRASGTTVQGIRRTEFEKVNIIRPPYEEQKAIASILTSFDDKIELLQAQNETLENIAQTIFKEWFGKYQVGDELPEGWRVDKLENISLEITRGFTTKYVDKSNLINLNQKVNKGSYLDKQHFKYYDDKTIVPENKFIKKYDILLNSLGEGTLGRVHLYCEETDNVVADQHISILRFDKKLAFYVYHVLTSKDGQFRLLNEISGSTGMTMLNISKVRQFEIIVPNDIILGEFKMIITALYEKLEINNSQIQTLQTTRDTLLPKLMSGQLRVTEFQEQLSEVM